MLQETQLSVQQFSVQVKHVPYIVVTVVETGWFRHTTRMDNFVHARTALTWVSKGKRKRGRPTIRRGRTILDKLKEAVIGARAPQKRLGTEKCEDTLSRRSVLRGIKRTSA